MARSSNRIFTNSFLFAVGRSIACLTKKNAYNSDDASEISHVSNTKKKKKLREGQSKEKKPQRFDAKHISFFFLSLLLSINVGAD